MNRIAKSFEPGAIYPARFTAEAFLRMFDSGAFGDSSMELVRGEIFEMNSSHSRHGLMLARLVAEFYSKVKKRTLPDVYIQLDNMSVRAFDVAVLKPGIVPDEVLKPEDVLLGVEVADSTIYRDLGEKLRHYAEAGIANYLVVDLTKNRTVLMSQPRGYDYEVRSEAMFDQPIALPGDLGTLDLS